MTRKVLLMHCRKKKIEGKLRLSLQHFGLLLWATSEQQWPLPRGCESESAPHSVPAVAFHSREFTVAGGLAVPFGSSCGRRTWRVAPDLPFPHQNQHRANDKTKHHSTRIFCSMKRPCTHTQTMKLIKGFNGISLIVLCICDIMRVIVF